MGKYIDTKYLRDHSYIDDDSEDDYLARLIDASEAHVANDLQCPLSTYEDGEGRLPADLMHAIVVYAATQYANREAVSFGQPQPVPYSYRDLITPYIHYT